MTTQEANKLFAFGLLPKQRRFGCDIPEGIWIYGYKGNDTEIVIPETIGKNKVIGLMYRDRAKYNFNSIEKVTFEGSIYVIDQNTFQHSRIRSISLPEGLLQIGSYAFYNSNLEEVAMPCSVQNVGSQSFMYCTMLKSVEFKGPSKICYEAFKDCIELYEVTFAKTMSDISDNAFWGCKALEKLQMPEHCEQVGLNVFRFCDSLKLESYLGVLYFADWAIKKEKEQKSVIIREGTYGIAPACFKSAKEIVSLVCPTTLKYIGPEAFSYCESLESAYMYECELIDVRAFKSCISLSTVGYSKKLRYIGSGAFENCYALRKPVIGCDTTLDTDVFKNCTFDKVTIYEGNTVWRGPFTFEHIFTEVKIKCLKILKEVDINLDDFADVDIEEIYVPDGASIYGNTKAKVYFLKKEELE